MNKTIKKIIYIAGVVIDNKELLTLVDKNYSNIFCHHMTIHFNNGDLNTLPNFIGTTFNFISDKLFKDENTIAITGIPSNKEIFNYMQNINQMAHITICTGKNIKPVYSNQLINSNLIYTPINLIVKMHVGAFCEFEDCTVDWIF